MQDLIELKGIRQGVLVTIYPDSDWGAAIAELLTRIDNQASFFRGASLVLHIEQHRIQRADLDQLMGLLEERQVKLICVLGNSAMTQSATRQLGLAISLEDLSSTQQDTRETARPEQAPQFPEQMFNSDMEGSEGILIRRTLRGGKVIKTTGHAIILGDVNPGAEIIAGGDIIVWGHLRGVVHAGALGDDSCVVCALNLEPTQIRIGTLLSISPPSKKRRKIRPERAYVDNGQIRAEAWSQ